MTVEPQGSSLEPTNHQVKNLILLVIALAVMGTIMLLPNPTPLQTPNGPLPLTAPGKASLAVLAMAVMLWATEAIPFPITALLSMVLLVVAKVESFTTLVKWGFGDSIVMFFIGVLIFTAAISETDLCKRFTTRLLYHLGHRPKAIILVFLIVGAMISAWITDMAVAAMMLPIGVAILRDAKVQPLKSNFGRALMISCAWGPLIGGIATPAGCGPNVVTMKFLKELAHIDFSFVDWMLLGFPAAILMIPIAWFILIKMFPLEPINLKMASEDFEKKMKELGPLKWKEVATLIIFVIMVALWLLPEPIKRWTGGRVDYLDISMVAVGAACLFYLPGINVIGWEKSEREISWGGIILIVAGLAMGQAIYATGAAGWLAYAVFHKIGVLHPIAIVFTVAFGISLLKVVFSSNTVTGAIMVPLMIALATTLNLDPRLVAIPAGITSSLAFILVTSTPTNVIPYSAGYFSIMDMVKAGIWMTIASSVCVTLSIVTMGKWFHIVNW